MIQEDLKRKADMFDWLIKCVKANPYNRSYDIDERRLRTRLLGDKILELVEGRR